MSERTWKLDPNSRYIVRRREGEPDVLFLWTPTLAQKTGFYPVTYDQAVAVKEAEDKYIAAKKAERIGYVPPEFQNPVVEEVAKPRPFEKVDDEARKLAKTNEDLLKGELDKVEGMTDSRALEEYFLMKYKIELIGDQPIDEMKKEAVKNLMALGNQNKLYEVK
jgi:hypothetical protein